VAELAPEPFRTLEKRKYFDPAGNRTTIARSITA